MLVKRDGYSWQVDTSNGDDFWEPFYLKGWEAEQSWVLSQVPAGGVFVDIGAWIGPWTLPASARGMRVHAYEPDPVAWERLRRNMEVSGTPGVIIARNRMVGVTAGTGSMRAQGEIWGGSNSGRWAEGATVAEFPMVDLGGVLDDAAKHGPPFVKMDVEGDEIDLFPLVAAARVPCHVSLHAPLAARAGDPIDFRHRLSPAFDRYRRLMVDGRRVMSAEQIPYERFCSVTCLRPR